MTIISIFGKFAYLFVASLFLGIFFGLGAAVITKKFECHNTPQVRAAPPPLGSAAPALCGGGYGRCLVPSSAWCSMTSFQAL